MKPELTESKKGLYGFATNGKKHLECIYHKITVRDFVMYTFRKEQVGAFSLDTLTWLVPTEYYEIKYISKTLFIARKDLLSNVWDIYNNGVILGNLPINKIYPQDYCSDSYVIEVESGCGIWYFSESEINPLLPCIHESIESLQSNKKLCLVEKKNGARFVYYPGNNQVITPDIHELLYINFLAPLVYDIVTKQRRYVLNCQSNTETPAPANCNINVT